MDYSEAIIKLEQSMKLMHENILAKNWDKVDIEADNVIFLARQLRDSITAEIQ